MRVIIVEVNEEGLPLRIDPEDAVGARLRIRLDWRTFAYLVVAILGALAVSRWSAVPRRCSPGSVSGW